MRETTPSGLKSRLETSLLASNSNDAPRWKFWLWLCVIVAPWIALLILWDGGFAKTLILSVAFVIMAVSFVTLVVVPKFLIAAAGKRADYDPMPSSRMLRAATLAALAAPFVIASLIPKAILKRVRKMRTPS